MSSVGAGVAAVWHVDRVRAGAGRRHWRGYVGWKGTKEQVGVCAWRKGASGRLGGVRGGCAGDSAALGPGGWGLGGALEARGEAVEDREAAGDAVAGALRRMEGHTPASGTHPRTDALHHHYYNYSVTKEQVRLDRVVGRGRGWGGRTMAGAGKVRTPG